MGPKHKQNRILKQLFAIKAFFAALFAVLALGYLSKEVYTLHKTEADLLNSAATPIVIDSALCATNTVRSNNLARLEPPSGQKLLGFHLDWKVQTPLQVRKVLGKSPAIINAFLDVDSTRTPPIRWPDLQWHSEEIARLGGIFQLTLEPTNMATMPDSLLEQIALTCLEINQRGVPMFLRYGHEMNGDWTTYGNKPVDYVAGFRRMANMVRKHTNMTAMVWAPNSGVNYPFTGGVNPYPTLLSDPINFAALDTTPDGVIDYKDDPYLPFYPGDEFVDWIGISLYWYPESDFNGPITKNYFLDQLTGKTINDPRTVPGGLRDFYQRFVQSKNKPLMIAETSAPYFDGGLGTASELEIKQNWWRQLYSPESFIQYPLLKAVIHFEEKKADGNQAVRDWRLLTNPTVRDAYNKDIELLGNKVLLATDLSYSCSGALDTKKNK